MKKKKERSAKNTLEAITERFTDLDSQIDCCNETIKEITDHDLSPKNES